MRVVICGGGVIAACTAYFLASGGVEVIVVERNAIAGAASGKAGGFLALDWCAASPLDMLARRSFALHARLAVELAGDWGHRGMSAYSGALRDPAHQHRSERAALKWLTEDVSISHRIGTPQTTAIVHPRKFTQGIMQAAQQHGAQVRIGEITELMHERAGAVRGVALGDMTIEADATVIAMGPWSALAARWLPLPPIFGQQSPSLVYQTDSDVGADALFL